MDLVFGKVDEVEVPHYEVGLTAQSQAGLIVIEDATEIAGGKSTNQRMPPRVWPNPELLPPPKQTTSQTGRRKRPTKGYVLAKPSHHLDG